MSRRVIRIIDMKIEVTGDEDVVRSSSSRGISMGTSWEDCCFVLV